MKQTVLKLGTILGFVFFLSTHIEAQTEHLSAIKIRQMDSQFTAHRARPRGFRSRSEFKTYRLHRHKHYRHRAAPYPLGYASKNPYNRAPRNYGIEYTHGYGHPKRGWVLAYQYDRAAFYDRDGFYYGYFNRYGYEFEGDFYRYDRFYTYRDRLRGRGLFDHRFYRPADYRYYGFCR